MLVFGARPEAIKMAPLYHALKAYSDEFGTLVSVTARDLWRLLSANFSRGFPCRRLRQVTPARLRQDKGHRAECQAFVDTLKTGGPDPIQFSSIITTTLASFRILESIVSGGACDVKTLEWLKSILPDSKQLATAAPQNFLKEA